jgi:hypothetical protein
MRPRSATPHGIPGYDSRACRIQFENGVSLTMLTVAFTTDGRQSGARQPNVPAKRSHQSREFNGRFAFAGQSAVAMSTTSATGPPTWALASKTARASPAQFVSPPPAK